MCERVEDGAAIVICAQGVARVRVRESVAVVIYTQVRCSRAFGMALPLGFTGNGWIELALEMALRL